MNRLLLPAAACGCLLLPAPCSLLLAAGCWLLLRLLLLLCPQRHGPAGWGNTMALKDEQSPKYAFPEAGTSLLKSPTKSVLYVSQGWLLARCCLLLPAAACCCLRLPAACCCLLLPAAACGCLLPAAACCSLLLRPQRHGPPGWGNTMALKDERSPK